MGMYTQVRGWLNIDSISHGQNEQSIINKLHKAREEFLESDYHCRKWVSHDTIIHFGGNGSAFLFFGTELKNYDDDAETWIKYLLDSFPNSEGRVDFQYETEEYSDDDSKSKYWLIREGKIIEEGHNKTWCKGYGNSFE
ncbi:hypothetical protein [Paenibacillus sp. ISL-20]|uniref:hypothetical protein n=1 Tax=Paenibacillus sp. ISL-20 TaxID=2819163 RepID=UPI001BE5AAB7|nr:hypothetical protein [Paenibacillus sp. ISL-20]MBT2759969.1 hypothetical protein [Paenibacillus sp. ISL-20]